MRDSSNNSGIDITDMVFGIFLILKLAEVGVVSTWSWWWIIAPLWMPCCLVLGIRFLITLCRRQ